MSLDDLRDKAAAAARTTRAIRERLRKSPALSLVAAFAAGYLAGVVLRIFDRRVDE